MRDAPLVTGGSGLAIGLARQWAQENGNQAREAGRPLAGRGVVLSGSCSQMTNRQVAHYRQIAPAREVDVARCLSTETLAAYAHELAEWVLGQKVYLLHWFLPPPALTHWQQFNSNTVHKKPVRQ
ncbi:hypothetical protein MUTS15_54750 [Escherichia coli]|nr:hypothetical protein MUTS15_54750 [Escherichia coli]